jgi:hypothetical protein
VWGAATVVQVVAGKVPNTPIHCASYKATLQRPWLVDRGRRE